MKSDNPKKLLERRYGVCLLAIVVAAGLITKYLPRERSKLWELFNASAAVAPADPEIPAEIVDDQSGDVDPIIQMPSYEMSDDVF